MAQIGIDWVSFSLLDEETGELKWIKKVELGKEIGVGTYGGYSTLYLNSKGGLLLLGSHDKVRALPFRFTEQVAGTKHLQMKTSLPEPTASRAPLVLDYSELDAMRYRKLSVDPGSPRRSPVKRNITAIAGLHSPSQEVSVFNSDHGDIANVQITNIKKDNREDESVYDFHSRVREDYQLNINQPSSPTRSPPKCFKKSVFSLSLKSENSNNQRPEDLNEEFSV
jgi:hypothetical protein